MRSPGRLDVPGDGADPQPQEDLDRVVGDAEDLDPDAQQREVDCKSGDPRRPGDRRRSGQWLTARDDRRHSNGGGASALPHPSQELRVRIDPVRTATRHDRARRCPGVAPGRGCRRGLAAVPRCPAQPGRGRAADGREPVGAGTVALRGLLGRSAAAAGRDVRCRSPSSATTPPSGSWGRWRLPSASWRRRRWDAQLAPLRPEGSGRARGGRRGGDGYPADGCRCGERRDPGGALRAGGRVGDGARSRLIGPGAPRLRFALLAGAFGASAALVKQNFIDVFVFAAVVLVLRARQVACTADGLSRWRVPSPWGPLLVGACVLGGAAILGTGPRELWDALVVFRAEASGVLAASATGVTAQRFAILVAALLATAHAVGRADIVAGPLAPRRADGARPDSGRSTYGSPPPMVLAWELARRAGRRQLLAALPGGARARSRTRWSEWRSSVTPSFGRGFRAGLGAGVDLDDRHDRRPRGSSRSPSPSSRPSTTCVPMPSRATPESSRSERRTSSGLPGSPAPTPACGASRPRPRPPAAHLHRGPGGAEPPRLAGGGGPSIATWGVDEDAALPYVEAYYTYRADAGSFRIYSLTERS